MFDYFIFSINLKFWKKDEEIIWICCLCLNCVLKCYFFYFTNQLFLLVLLLLAGVYIRSKFKSLIIFHMNSLRVDGIFNMAFRSLGVSHGDRHCLSPLCSFSLFSFLHSLNWGPIMENRIKSLCWFQFQRPSEIGLSRNSFGQWGTAASMPVSFL